MHVSLNYLWKTPKPMRLPKHGRYWVDTDEMVCPIPERFLNNLRKARRDNPGVIINVWTDVFGPKDKQGRIAQFYAAALGIEGVSFRGLREIPEYQNTKLFNQKATLSQSSAGPLWQQVDLAKLILLRYMLSVYQGVAVFTDFDLIDPPVNADLVSQVMEARVVFDGSPHIEGGFFENRYLAVSASRNLESFRFLDELIKHTVEAYTQPKCPNSNGWNAFCRKSKSFVLGKDSEKEDQAKFFVKVNEPSKDHSDYHGFEV